MALDGEGVAAALEEAVPSVGPVLVDHRRDHGPVRLETLFAECVPVAAAAWADGRPGFLDGLAAFMGRSLDDGDAALRDAVVRGFVDRVMAYGVGPKVDEMTAGWPAPLRAELDHRRTQRVPLGHGVWLEHAEPEPLVDVLWTVLDETEAVAVADGVVFIVGSVIQAVRADRAEQLWQFERPDGDALESSGEVMVGCQGDDDIDVVAPYEYRVRLDRASGRTLEWSDEEDGSATPPPFPHLPPTSFAVRHDGLGRHEVHDADGGLLLAVAVQQPNVDPAPPAETDGVLILPIASGHVLSITRRS